METFEKILKREISISQLELPQALSLAAYLQKRDSMIQYQNMVYQRIAFLQFLQSNQQFKKQNMKSISSITIASSKYQTKLNNIENYLNNFLLSILKLISMVFNIIIGIITLILYFKNDFNNQCGENCGYALICLFFVFGAAQIAKFIIECRFNPSPPAAPAPVTSAT